MSNDVLDFLTKLATEPQVFSDFLSDPAAVLKREGVDETAQKALLSRDPMRVYAAIRGEATAYEAAHDKSASNAKTILDILASDPTVAGWLYANYAQAIQYAQATQWSALGYVAGTTSATAPPANPVNQ
jgi:hypothetical protein